MFKTLKKKMFFWKSHVLGTPSPLKKRVLSQKKDVFLEREPPKNTQRRKGKNNPKTLAGLFV